MEADDPREIPGQFPAYAAAMPPILCASRRIAAGGALPVPERCALECMTDMLIRSSQLGGLTAAAGSTPATRTIWLRR
ncbi:MAG: hypothetical protein ACLUEQ_08015 [Cloacibacillus evryensis]